MSSVEQVLGMFDINDESLVAIKDCIAKEFELGLSDEDSATIKMLITYVRELSRGDESGTYLALDLGGTHFRVLLVELKEGRAKVTSAVHDIPHSLLVTQNGRDLFDYIALKLLEFVQQYKLKRRRISLGFTFSFPCKQYGLTQSVLVKWCKGFNVGGVVGTDVVKQLKDALKRQLAGLVEAYIDVVAVINDTTGTLVACANSNRDCRIGLIVGTGFNACYIERLDRCEKWPANYTNPKQVIINCEWGALGDNKIKRELDKFRNEIDVEVDEKSINPKNQTYEKMVAGLYIGELLRLAMLKLYKSKLLFEKMSSSNKQAKQRQQRQQQQQQQQQQPIATKSVSPQVAATSPSSPSSGSSQATSSSTSGGGGSSTATGSTGSSSMSSSKSSPRTSVSGASSRASSTSGINSTSSSARSSRVSGSSAPSIPGPSSQTRRSSSAASPATSGATETAGGQNSSSSSSSASSSQGGHKLHVKDCIDGSHLSRLAKDELSGTFEETAKILKELNITEASQKDMAIVVQLSSRIMHRSANLVASGISALLEKIKKPFTVIGYDGSVIKHHPYFLKKLAEKCAKLTPREYRFEFMLSSDGSGIGAAVVAAALHKERRPLYVVKAGKLYEMHFTRNQQSSIDSSINTPSTGNTTTK